MECFGCAAASWLGAATSWRMGPLAAAKPKAASGSAANMPVELMDLRKRRRFRPSFCIWSAPERICFVHELSWSTHLVNGGYLWQMRRCRGLAGCGDGNCLE